MGRQYVSGDLVRVTKNSYEGTDRGFDPGTVVRIRRTPREGSNYLQCEYLDRHDWWYVGADECEPYVESKESNVPVEWQVYGTDGKPIAPGPEQRKTAWLWAVEQIPEADTGEIVKLAEWVLTGEWKA